MCFAHCGADKRGFMKLLQQVDAVIRKIDKRAMFALCLFMGFVIYSMNKQLGTELPLALLYFLPIGLTAWYVGAGAGFAMVILSVSYRFIALFITDYADDRVWVSVASLALFFSIFSLFCYLIYRTQYLLRELTIASQTDFLTRAASRRYFTQMGNTELTRAHRLKSYVTLIFIDLDGFKKINDALGHEEGDQILIRVAEIIKSSLRAGEILGRIGGDEFAVLLPNTDGEKAKPLIARMRSNLMADQRVNASGVTFSMGVATSSIIKLARFNELMSVADQSMYSIKNTTKNASAFAKLTGERTGAYKTLGATTEEPLLMSINK